MSMITRQRVGLGDVLGEVALAAQLPHPLDVEVGELLDAGLAVLRRWPA